MVELQNDLNAIKLWKNPLRERGLPWEGYKGDHMKESFLTKGKKGDRGTQLRTCTEVLDFKTFCMATQRKILRRGRTGREKQNKGGTMRKVHRGCASQHGCDLRWRGG